ncbi:family 20 glycosylhydrolase [Nguyenibacter vanlangensis]|uniref:beta-N-acetylhexosaminidase n=1 Tax=Nguyenibacter vanlangensis TaxID=1216886 RepID=A0ABZ3D0H8_9PROT
MLRFPFRTMCAALLAATACSPLAPAQAAPALLPRPAAVEAGQGAFALTGPVTIVAPAGDEAARFAATWLSHALHDATGGRFAVGAAGTAGRTIVLERAAVPGLPAEGYVLTVAPAGIRITASDEAGLFYGAVTLAQMPGAQMPGAQMPGTQTPGAGGAIAAVRIRDWPRLSWRGAMLDSARHFQTPDAIRALLDAMAALKLNTLHWHLTDDQGWRLEIRRYPRLTAVGGWRRSPVSGPRGDGAPYGGFYSQAEVRAIVAYAAARHITIVPEIEMPGHARAAIAAYPELGVTGRDPGVATDYGVLPWLYNVDDHTMQFVRDVLDEVMELFPSTFIHLGGDEAIKDQWRASPAVQARLHALGLRGEEQLESWFIEQGGRYLAAHGRRMIGWDEILRGGLPPSASVMSWHGVDGALAAARAGHDAVVAPEHLVYLDFLQGGPADRLSGGRYQPEAIAGITGFDPAPASLAPEVSRHIIGVEAPIWTEYLTDGHAVQQAAFPRLDAVAEAGWTPQALRAPADFTARLAVEVLRQKAAGLPVSDAPFAVALTARPAPAASGGAAAIVTMTTQSGYGAIRYTTDGSLPTASSVLYTHPVHVGLQAPVTAATFLPDRRMLAAPTTIRAADAIWTRQSDALTACPGGEYSVRIPRTPDAASNTASSRFFSIDPNTACWAWRAAPSGATQVAVTVVPMAWSFMQPGEKAAIRRYPVSEPDGVVIVRGAGCTGPDLARLPLPPMTAGGPAVTARGSLPADGGTPRDLCVITASRHPGAPYAAVADITLSGTPQGALSGAAGR